MKKILSLVLVIALVLGSFSFAFADSHVPADVVGEDYQQAVEVLMALGVVNGYPDGTYKPERVVTRAEMAKLLVEALGYGQLAGGTAPYSDTAGHWAQGSIGLATGIGLVQGYPDGTFKPDDYVTFDEAVTMILRALGYTDESLRGAWPTNYKIKAIDLGLYDGTSAQTGDADRGNIAIMLFNALDMAQVEIKEGVATEVVIDSVVQKLIDKIGDKVRDEIEYAMIYDEDSDVYLETAIDLTPYLYHDITYYLNRDDEVAYVSKVHTKEFVGTVTATASALMVSVEDANELERTFDTTGASLFFNGDEAPSTMDVTDLNTNGTATVRVIYTGTAGPNAVVKGVVAEQFRTVQIDSVYNVRSPFQLNGTNIKLPVALDSDDDEVLDTANLTIMGDVATLSAIEEDDVVHVYESAKDSEKAGYPSVVKLVVARNVVTADYVLKSGSNYTFGNVVYQLSPTTGTIVFVNPDGESYDLFLDKDGKIFAAELASETAAATGYGVFVAEADGTASSTDSTVIGGGSNYVKTTPRVQLFTAGGDLVTYNVTTGTLKTATTTWTAGDTVDIGADLDLVYSGTIDTTGNISVSTTAIKGTLVKYELNSSGELTSLAIMDNAYIAAEFDKDDMLLDGYYVTAATVIFNTSSTDEDDWTVVDSSRLTDTITGDYAASTTNYRVLAMTVDNISTAETYAVIKTIGAFYDGDELVQRVTAYVDGVSVTYLTDNSALFTNTNVKVGGHDESLVILEFDGDRITDFTTEGAITTDVEITVDTIETLGFRHTDGQLYRIASDAVVYVRDGSTSYTTTVGEMSSVIRNDNVTLFNTVTESSGPVVYEIILLDITTTP